MRYKIFSLDQEVLIELGLGVEESLLLDWILNWKDGSGMKRAFIDEKQDIGYWVNYSTVVNELPILFKQPSENMNEDELNKLNRNNKDKVGRLLKKLNKVLTPVRKVKQGAKGKQGSEIYIVLNRETVDQLKGFENKKVEPSPADKIDEELKANKGVDSDNASEICHRVQSKNQDLRLKAIENIRNRNKNFDKYKPSTQEVLIDNEIEKLAGGKSK